MAFLVSHFRQPNLHFRRGGAQNMISPSPAKNRLPAGFVPADKIPAVRFAPKNVTVGTYWGPRRLWRAAWSDKGGRDESTVFLGAPRNCDRSLQIPSPVDDSREAALAIDVGGLPRILATRYWDVNKCCVGAAISDDPKRQG